MDTVIEIETRLLEFAARFKGRLPDQDIENARYLVLKREWAVGLEVLCAQLSEHDAKLSADERGTLRTLAEQVGVDVQRFVDNLADGIAMESKVGRTSLTTRVELQIQKDVELMSTPRSGVNSVE